MIRNSSRKRIKANARDVNRHFIEECKEVDLSSDIYSMNEAKIKDLEISIDTSKLPIDDMQPFNPTKADCRICLQEAKILNSPQDDPLNDEFLVSNPCR
mmetsp:Transcript_4688/g.3945  ORF Transcript_4688/g.3945 Transcript_4688/m.3945 type:complete len:99 (-) Transcript_4688:243-539(-)